MSNKPYFIEWIRNVEFIFENYMWRQWCLITNLSHIHMVIMNIRSKLIPNSIFSSGLKAFQEKMWTCRVPAICVFTNGTWIRCDRLNYECEIYFGKFHLGTMVSHHMSQTDLNSKLIPNTTFLIVFWKKKEKEPPKKKSKKINQKKSNNP